MDDFSKTAKELTNTLTDLFQISEDNRVSELLKHAVSDLEHVDRESWGRGVDIFELHLQIPITLYANISDEIRVFEKKILEKLQPIMRRSPEMHISSVIISPILDSSERISVDGYKIDNVKLIQELELQKSLMITVSTGVDRIQNVNSIYIERQNMIELGLGERLIKNPNSYKDLWAWYHKWHSGDLPSYSSRRAFLGELFDPLIKRLKGSIKTQGIEDYEEPTGWVRVDRTVGEIRKRLEEASTEEQFQAVGLLCRDVLISLAQVVFDRSKHCVEDDLSISDTDVKRMLDAYLSVEIAGNENEAIRKYAKASLDLANVLTHKRTADFRQAALCTQATTSVINIIAIISGRRDP